MKNKEPKVKAAIFTSLLPKNCRSGHPDDPHDLNRFIKAQVVNYEEAIIELSAGLKRTHWSWYIFPQIQGLGTSQMSRRYAISGLPEAKAYLAHPILGVRLRECMTAMNTHTGLTAAAILGDIDARKFQSCITLFAQVAESDSPFHAAIDKYFAAVQDPATLVILARQVAAM